MSPEVLEELYTIQYQLLETHSKITKEVWLQFEDYLNKDTDKHAISLVSQLNKFNKLWISCYWKSFEDGFIGIYCSLTLEFKEPIMFKYHRVESFLSENSYYPGENEASKYKNDADLDNVTIMKLQLVRVWLYSKNQKKG